MNNNTPVGQNMDMQCDNCCGLEGYQTHSDKNRNRGNHVIVFVDVSHNLACIVWHA
jgi:hypothetical protein